MLSLPRQSGRSQRKSVYYTDKAVVRGHMENCHANCQETCGE